MNTYLQTGKTYIKKPWVIGVLAILLLIVIFAVRGNATEAQGEIVEVKQGNVSEEVSVTGKVKAAQAVDLSFEKSGKVIKISKKVGDQVEAGETIVQIDNADTYAELAQAQAALKYQQSRLSELESGTRPEQLNITKTKAESARVDLINARSSFVTAMQNAYSSADDAIRSKVDLFFTNPRTANPQLLFASRVNPETSLETGRVEVETRLKEMKSLLATVTPTSELGPVSSAMKQDLGEIKLFMDNISYSVNALTPADYLSDTTLTGWKNNLSAARTSLNSSITAMLSAENAYESARSGYAVASQQLTLDSSGTVSQGIQAQQAQVAQAQANVSAVYARLAKTTIKAPITGVITKQEAKLGETITPNTTIVSVMTDATFEIEAFIPEADISKIRTGEVAKVTLDAYGPEVLFDAKVVTVAPAETVIDGVPTYKTTFQFSGSDDRIKSGMTANVDIKGQSRENVLYVPQRAVLNKNGSRYVILHIDADTTTEVNVKTGLRGSQGEVEITEGLSLGDKVIVRQK